MIQVDYLEDKYYEDEAKKGQEEYEANDPVHQSVRRVYFVSRSKGIRHTKKGSYRRYRREWKEVELLSYLGGPFHTWRNFPFDVYATEVLGDVPDSERIFKKKVRAL